MNVRSAGRLLFQRLGIRQGFQPDWREERFLQSLSSRSGAFRAFRMSHSAHPSLNAAALFFRERALPRFFVDGPEIPPLVSRIEKDHPSWKEETIRRTRVECQNGLGIYASRGPALSRAFPWGRLERGPGGDKLHRKRPHRFAFAPRLALSALYGEPGDRALEDVLLGWMEFASGRTNDLAYDSNLAVIQRILALSWAWAFLAARAHPGERDLELEGRLLQVVHEDAAFLDPRLGHSAANNHLLADGFAGWFLGVVWPELSDELQRRFEPLWLRELDRQILADGTSFEHSTHYHEYACEMAVAYVILSRRNGLSVPEWALDRTRRLLQFQVSLAECGSGAVAIGDAAEDPLFPLDGGDGWGTGAWPDVLAALFDAAVPALGGASSRSRERAFWLLGGALSDRAAAVPRSGMERFPHGGYFLLRDEALRSALVFRTGPISGEASAPGHTHADCMSVYLVAGGRPLLVDSGTFTYRRASERWPRGEPDWRGYFTGPSAHNTLAIDGHDPLGDFEGDFRRQLGNFVSAEKSVSDPVTSWVHAAFEGEGAYAGYRRGVIHALGEYWIVYDDLPPFPERAGGHLGFQFHPDCRIERLEDREVEARSEGIVLRLGASAGLRPPIVLTGSRDPLGGWVSRMYGELVASPQVRFPIGETAAAAFLLRLLREEDAKGEAATIEVERIGSDGLRLDVTIGPIEDTLLVSLRAHDRELHSRGLRFRGDLARLRRLSGRLQLVHWLNGRRLVSPDIGLVVESPETLPALTIDPEGARAGSASANGVSIRWPSASDSGSDSCSR